MEMSIFALIASYNAHRKQECKVAEPQEFKPFDLQALRDFAQTRSQAGDQVGARRSGRKQSDFFDYGFKI